MIDGAVGLVLAGGASRRMGRDKALMVVDGRRMVDHALAALRTTTPRVAVAIGRRPIDGLDVPSLPDPAGAVGPLAGIAAGLAWAAALDTAAGRDDGGAAPPPRAVLVHAVDLAFPSPALDRALIDRWEGEPALIPTGDGRAQPLHGLWSTGAAADLARLVADGMVRVWEALELLGATTLDPAATRRLVADDRWATNLNSPEDLDELDNGPR